MKCNGVYALVVLRVFSHRHSPGRVPWYGQIEADHVAGEPRIQPNSHAVADLNKHQQVEEGSRCGNDDRTSLHVKNIV